MAATLDAAKTLLGDRIRASHDRLGEDTIVVDAKDLHAVLRALRDDASLALDFLSDLTAVDWMAAPNGPAMKKIGWPPPHRFETIYQLTSLTKPNRLRVCAALCRVSGAAATPLERRCPRP